MTLLTILTDHCIQVKIAYAPMRLAFLEFDLAEAAKIYKIAIFLGGVISET